MTTYLTDADVAQRFNKSREFVQRQCKAGWPHMRVGKSYRFTEAHIRAIEALCEAAPAPATPAKAFDRVGRSA